MQSDIWLWKQFSLQTVPGSGRDRLLLTVRLLPQWGDARQEKKRFDDERMTQSDRPAKTQGFEAFYTAYHDQRSSHPHRADRYLLATYATALSEAILVASATLPASCGELLEWLNMRDETAVDEQVHGEPEWLVTHSEGNVVVGSQVQTQR